MFALKFLRLVLSVAAEALYNGLAMAVFYVFRRREPWRRRIRELMKRTDLARPCAVALAALLVVAAAGCNSTHPGGSFERQIENTAWSVEVLFDQSGDFDGLTNDLGIFFDPEWGELPRTLNMIGW